MWSAALAEVAKPVEAQTPGGIGCSNNKEFYCFRSGIYFILRSKCGPGAMAALSDKQGHFLGIRIGERSEE
jgi:hypothetical protein